MTGVLCKWSWLCLILHSCSYPPLQPACFSKKKKVFNSESNTKLNELRDSDAQTMSKSLDQPPKLSTKTVVPPEGTPV